MSPIKPGRIWGSGLLLLTLFPGWALGEQSPVNSTSLVLEVRYCECAVVNPDGPQVDVLPGFLEESTRLQADVPEAGRGSLSTDDISLTFEVGDVKDSPGTYRFTHSGSYATGTGYSSSKADLMLMEGQWVPLVQIGQKSTGENTVYGVAARLVDVRGS
ncbi:hypothetical protein [Marinobacter zhanjiangensis]|uniref:Uncharacterized protein n=1 Tax=Marinobacter zhanjiangensis TaxID=578215 RepID=A0ABQ3AQD1_9GAMM|nr:hypothetical protein [Marinobacter zhanjiangensis]GGY60724.1 hypothetical protein GCM10007071_04300 [Marinobacter zhanjiangensis]